MDSTELPSCRVVVVNNSEDVPVEVEPVPFSASAARNPNPLGVDQCGGHPCHPSNPLLPYNFAVAILVKSVIRHQSMQR
jgi:hypothetical protein